MNKASGNKAAYRGMGSIDFFAVARSGLCPKQCGKPAEDLVLVNNGRRFTVRFDCRNCEMVLI